jgi:copper(I)-binding protein
MDVNLARGLAAAALIALAGPAAAHEYKAGDIEIAHPWSRATVAGAKVGAGYLSVVNHGRDPDRLVSVSADFAARAEMHESLVEGGVAKMRPIDSVEIEPGAAVEFAPGGKHLMFVGLKQTLAKGERLKGSLTFERAGTVPVEFVVEAAGARPTAESAASDHKGH